MSFTAMGLKVFWERKPQISTPSRTTNNSCYCMTSFVSGQDEPNRAPWLATRAGKMGLSWPLGTTRRFPLKKFPLKPNNKSFIDQAFSVKMAGYWPRSFFRVYRPRLRLGPWTRKKETWPISSHLDRKSLVNNPYLTLKREISAVRTRGVMEEK